MKRLFSLFFASTLILFGIISPEVAFASANDFYFSDSTFDYYLEKDPYTGYSTMRIEESLTAVFPSIDQNHGIERCIPRTYRGVESLDVSSFSVSRNGSPENFTTYKNDSLTCFRIGNASSYVHGSQTYDISYTMNNVILEPDNSEYQELYWDTNGVEWSQKFDKLTANVHLTDELVNAWIGETSCYVGAQGTSGTAAMSRCETSVSDDKSVITFSATNLAPRENLTFDLPFMPKTFAIKTPTPNYLLYVAGVILIIVFGWSIFLWIKAGEKVKDKKALAKDKACPVQYTPPKDLTVAEAGTSYLKSVSNLQVASLIELAVKHHIELEKGDKKTFGGYHWKIHIKNLDGISSEQKIVLEIINGGDPVTPGETIEVKRCSYSYRLEQLGRSFSTTIESSLKSKGLFESEKNKKSGLCMSILAAVIYFFVSIGAFILATSESANTDLYSSFTTIFCIAVFALLFLYVILFIFVAAEFEKYNKRTLEGIKVSRYLDGLKEYMDLAEKDRIEFLQSVKGADTSNQGIVKLYEKLLPYAVLFNIEESWMDELNRYYKMNDVNDPYWMYGAIYFSSRDFREFSSYARNTISSSTASSSSGSSGGGGGGFSGGGGGGGGGGGW